jgi:NADH:ubiquinone oxidoreductase subunit K
MMFFSISLNFVFFSVYLYNSLGQVLCLFVVTSAAAETAVGLSLLVTACRLGNEVNYDSLVSFLRLKKKLKKSFSWVILHFFLLCFLF